MIGSFEWLTPGEAAFSPGEAAFSPGEAVAGVPAQAVYPSLKSIRAALADPSGRGEAEFRLLVCD